MTDFIMVPAIMAICVFGFYKFVELLTHRKERLLMVEKISEISAANDINLSRIFGSSSGGSRFIPLRFGAAFFGIGLGLLTGFVIAYSIFGVSWFVDSGDNYYRVKQAIGVIYGASTLIFGGLSLLGCFLLEQKYRKEGK